MTRNLLIRIMRSGAFRIIKQFRELWVIGAFLIAVVVNPLNPDLTIDYEHKPIFLPSLLESQSRHKGQGELALLIIQVSNHTRKIIDGIELQVGGVSEVLEVGAQTSSSRLAANLDKLRQIASISEHNYYFPNLSIIPPGHNVQLQLVVRERFHHMSKVNVTSSAETHSVTKRTTVSGITVLLYDYFDVLGAALLTLLIGLGFWRLSRDVP